MDVDIDVVGIDIKVQKIRHLFALWNQSVVSSHHRLIEIRMLHISSVHEEKLMGSFLACSFRLSHKTGNLTHGGFYVDRQEVLIDTLSKYIDDALSEITCLQIKQFCIVAVKRKGNLRIDQYDAFKCSQDII